MTPLDRLAEVLSRMAEFPWEAHPENPNDSASVGFKHFIRENGERDWYTVATFHFDDADAIGVAALRNLAPLLIDVVRAARQLNLGVPPDAPSHEMEMHSIQNGRVSEMDAALTALDSAITKELGE